MHGSVRRELESFLEGRADAAGAVEQHLRVCSSCAGEATAARAHSQLLRSLKAQSDLEPQAGFYARVMQRIEERAKGSIWAVFIDSPFGKRLALASLSVALLLGSYVFAAEKMDGDLRTEPMADQQVHYDMPMDGNQAQQRDAVLVNFAAHPDESKSGESK